MDRIRIAGGRRLVGSIPISGAKNATLPLMIASLLTDQRLTLENVPDLADVGLLKRILANHGVDYMVSGKRANDSPNAGETLTLSAENIVDTTAPYELVSRMRASFWVVGPLLARMHEARVSLPGGCAIGTRPVDFFLMGLEALGAEIAIEAGYVLAKAPRGLIGGRVRFPHASVGATHTIMMAATLAKGESVIENAAREPEVRNLAECLIKMGAKIEGAGTDTISVVGVDRLGGATHRVLPDRIETGTYAMAVAAAGGDVLLQGAEPDLLQSALDIPRRRRSGNQRDERRHSRRAKRHRAFARRHRHRAVSGLSHRSPSPVHGADDARRGHFGDPRDDLREPLHARPRARQTRRRHPSRRTDGEGNGREAADRRTRSWQPTFALPSRSSLPASSRKARRWSTASIISIAASSGWSRSFPPAARRSNACGS